MGYASSAIAQLANRPLGSPVSRSNRFLSAPTDVASVIVSDSPAMLLRQACSRPPYQGMYTLVTFQRCEGTRPAATIR
jgi:hypothetical protein